MLAFVRAGGLWVPLRDQAKLSFQQNFNANLVGCILRLTNLLLLSIDRLSSCIVNDSSYLTVLNEEKNTSTILVI